MDELTGRIGGTAALGAGEALWLLGQPSLEDYLDAVKFESAGGEERPRDVLASEWRAANDVYHALEAEEAGEADAVELLPLDPAMAGSEARLRADPRHRGAFASVPTTLAMVELDRLVVSSNELVAVPVAPPVMLPEQLFDFCLPINAPPPPVRIVRLASGRYLFACNAQDLAPCEAALLGRDAFASLDRGEGPIMGALALPVSLGSPLMSVISSDSRLVLHNGHKRAYALRAAGITHAPCVVHEVTRTDELALVARSAVVEAPAFYFRAKRPPLLRDFFDPRLVKRLSVRPQETVVEIEFKVRVGPALDW